MCSLKSVRIGNTVKNGKMYRDRDIPVYLSRNGRYLDNAGRCCLSCRLVVYVPYFDAVVGFARSYEPESYARGSLLMLGSPMPGRSKMMTQTKRDALARQVGGR